MAIIKIGKIESYNLKGSMLYDDTVDYRKYIRPW